MNRILILVEGPTEEAFIKHVLNPYFLSKNIWLIPTIITTKRVKRGPDFKGGIPGYDKVKNELKKLLNDSSAALITTMFDYYGLPSSFPGREKPIGSNPLEKVQYVENSFAHDVNHTRFLPYLSLHEFETLLFSDPAMIAKSMIKPKLDQNIISIRESFDSPEDINDNPHTAPSKRLTRIFPQYDKIFYGRLIAERIGLDRIRNECFHFDKWVRSIESIDSACTVSG